MPSTKPPALFSAGGFVDVCALPIYIPPLVGATRSFDPEPGNPSGPFDWCRQCFAGRFEVLFPYTVGYVCDQDEKLSLEKKSTSTSGSTVVVDKSAYDDAGFMENTLYCINPATGNKRDVTNEAYNEVLKLQTRIGW